MLSHPKITVAPMVSIIIALDKTISVAKNIYKTGIPSPKNSAHKIDKTEQ